MMAYKKKKKEEKKVDVKKGKKKPLTLTKEEMVMAQHATLRRNRK